LKNNELNERLIRIDERLGIINFELGKLIGAQKTSTILIKFVILPLIAVLGAMMGIRLF